MNTLAIVHRLYLPLCMLASGWAGAQQAQTPEHWPCVQAFVPTVPAAVVWDGPPVDEYSNQWQSAMEVNLLVSRLVSPQMSLPEAEKEIGAFAENQPADQKNKMLTLLFSGILSSLNADRTRLMSGIISYSRGQEQRAQQLGDVLDQIARLEQDDSEAAQKKLTELHESVGIGQRMFDERESSIQYLCTRPIAVEQRLGALARAIAYHLD